MKYRAIGSGRTIAVTATATIAGPATSPGIHMGLPNQVDAMTVRRSCLLPAVHQPIGFRTRLP